MKKLNQYIQEKFELNKNTKRTYKYSPKNEDELRKIIKERLKEDENADLNNIDISKITNMSNLFYDLDPHNINMEYWDVSKVTDMNSMFFECGNFNSDLSNWNVSQVRCMDAMFYGCKKFTGKGLEDWEVTNLEDKTFTFDGCESLKNKPSWYKE